MLSCKKYKMRIHMFRMCVVSAIQYRTGPTLPHWKSGDFSGPEQVTDKIGADNGRWSDLSRVDLIKVFVTPWDVAAYLVQYPVVLATTSISPLLVRSAHAGHPLLLLRHCDFPHSRCLAGTLWRHNLDPDTELLSNHLHERQGSIRSLSNLCKIHDHMQDGCMPSLYDLRSI